MNEFILAIYFAMLNTFYEVLYYNYEYYGNLLNYVLSSSKKT